MARIRSIKPEYWSDTRMARLDALTRLVYLCLWSMADDEGRLEGDVEAVRRFGSFREDSRELAKSLASLASLQRIVRYEVDGNPYIAIFRFNKHQKIDHPTKSKIPAPSEGCEIDSEPLANPRESSRKLAPDQGSGIRDQGKDKHTTLGVAELVSAGVEAKHARDWLKARKAKRLPLTETALDDVKAEAEKAGLTLADAVKAAATRGWAGFRASWLTEGSADPNAVAAEAERLMQERANANHGH